MTVSLSSFTTLFTNIFTGIVAAVWDTELFTGYSFGSIILGLIVITFVFAFLRWVIYHDNA